jgi:hypothetical protein
MENVLTQSVKIGKFQVPMGLLLLSGASLLAIVALTQKKKSAGSENANALIGQYDPSIDENAGSVSMPPAFALNPTNAQGVQTSIVEVPKYTVSNAGANDPTLIDINTAIAKYPQALSLVNQFADSFPSFGGVPGVKNTYAWYDVNKNSLIDNETKARFYG